MSTDAKLFLASHVAGLWENVVRPWFERAGQTAWRQQTPTAVLVPSRSYGSFLKSKLLDAGLGFAGISFWTPSDIRSFLLEQFADAPPIVFRENLHLLLAIAAEQHPDLPTAKAVAMEPAGLMHSLDLIASAGWDFDGIEGESLRTLTASFLEILRQSGFKTVQQTDRWLEDKIHRRQGGTRNSSSVAKAREDKEVITAEAGRGSQNISGLDKSSPYVTQNDGNIFHSLLIIGFDGAHWPMWNILRAATRASKEAGVCLMEPRFRAEKIDMTWIGSWEEFLQPALPVPESDQNFQRPFENLAACMEGEGIAECGSTLLTTLSPSRMGGTRNAEYGKQTSELETVNREPGTRNPENERAIFLIGQNIRDQVEAIVTQAVAFLGEKSCSRLGILFPGYGALSREVAARLGQLQIPHNDALGHYNAVQAGNEEWKLWIALQANPRMDSLVRFLRASPKAREIFDFPIKKIEKALNDAFSEMLVDDLPVLAAFLGRSREEEQRKIGAVLKSWPFLPSKANLAEFGRLIKIEAKTFGMDMDFRILDELAPHLQIEFSREIFLRWFAETIKTPAKIRDPCGNHPYSRIQLLPYSQGDHQAWSHLILAGLNEGEWPPRFEETGFLSEKQIAALNGQALTTGAQGEGHTTVKPGKALCLGPVEARILAQRQFHNLMESVEVCLCLTASLTRETEPGRRLVPGDLLANLFLADQGRPLTDELILELRDWTADRVKSSLLAKNLENVSTDLNFPVPVEQTRRAHNARRDASKPFGEFEFALKKPRTKPVTLACKKWEDALKSPAIVWLNKVLRIEPEKNALAEDSWSRVMGTWVHDWLRKGVSGERIQEKDIKGHDLEISFPGAADFLAAVKTSAEGTRHLAREIFEETGRSLPEWWVAGWQKALWIARLMAKNVSRIPGFPLVSAEMNLASDTAFFCANGKALYLRGKLDLLLMDRPTGKGEKPREGQKLWVLDYKTGDSKPISARKLIQGKGVQPALYALALHSMGAIQIDASIVASGEPVQPQISVDEILSRQSLWEGLCRMQETGIFGMRGELRPEFGPRANYPIATLEIDKDILDQKWALTHPGLVEGGNED